MEVFAAPVEGSAKYHLYEVTLLVIRLHPEVVDVNTGGALKETLLQLTVDVNGDNTGLK